MSLTLPDAGRELDAMVAEKIMGYKLLPGSYKVFSTGIGSAWSVVENMQARGYWVKITGPWQPTDPPSPVEDLRGRMGSGCHGYSVGFDKHGQVACGSSWVQAENASICVAICHAALITLESDSRCDADGNLMAPDGWQTAGRRKVEFGDHFLTEDGRVGWQDGFVVFKDDGIRMILQRLDPDVARDSAK